MESRKTVMMNLLAGQQWKGKYREQTCGHSGGRRRGDALREYHGNIHITIYKIEASGDLLYDARTSDRCSMTT